MDLSSTVRRWTAGCAALLAVACVNPPASQVPTARDAIDRMYDSGRCSNVLSGEGKMDYFGDDGRIRVTVLYLVERPGSVRLDLVSPLGGSLSTLTSDGRRFSLLDRSNRQFLTGPATQCNVEAFLHVPVPPQALVQLLSGEAPILEHDRGQATIVWEDGHYLLRVHGKHSATQQVWLRPRAEDWDKPWAEQRMQVSRVRVLQHGHLLFEARLSHHRTATRAPVDPDGTGPSGPECDAEVPGRVQFQVPSHGQDILIEQQQVEHNPAIGVGAFRQEAPPGVVVRNARCFERK